MVVIVGQGDIAREIDPHAIALADGDGGKDVEKAVEHLGRGLPGALGKSLPHESLPFAVRALPVPASSIAPSAPIASDTPKIRR